MCGIAGFCSFEQDFLQQEEQWNRILIRMREALAHRGPDSFGEYLRKHVGLSHARLSIRDLSFGTQPMVKKLGEYEYTIVYNGEIYNVEDLKPSLIASGYQFETTTDTEVILLGYIRDGLDFVEKLNGIYAFGIWDGKLNRLVLVRDRLGVKPLFYTVQNNCLVFGSEIKSLFAHPQIKPIMDMNSLREIFGIGPAKTPGCGVFKDIHEVLPGHVSVFSQSGLSTRRYWELTACEHSDDYESTVEKVSFLVRDSITRQMVADVPVCSFLSGGIDSGIVTAVASNYLTFKGAVLDTYSFDFKGNDTYFQSNAFQPEQDRPFVDLMRKSYNVNHRYLECDEESLVNLLYASVDSKDLPGMADIDASLLYFCSMVRKNHKVALTGECADEIFGGYPWFYREDLLNGHGFPWSKDLSVRTFFLSQELIRELSLEEYVLDRYHDTVRNTPLLVKESPADAKCKEITYLNIRWFMQTLLDRMDRASMACGIEARVPFADHRIVEYVYNVPWKMKYRENTAKSLLRAACADLLPLEILLRKKSPYPKTYHPNYEKRIVQIFSDVVNSADSPILPMLDPEKVRSFLKEPTLHQRPWFGQLMAGIQLLAYLIQVNYRLKGVVGLNMP